MFIHLVANLPNIYFSALPSHMLFSLASNALTPTSKAQNLT